MAIFAVPIVMGLIIIKGSGHDNTLLMLAQNKDYVSYLTLSLIGAIMMTTGINNIACTSVSREGKLFWISKTIPVRPRYQIIAKIIHSMFFSLFGILFIGILAGIYFNLAIWRIIAVIGIGFLGSFLIVCLNLLIDVKWPKLNWVNPHEAIKNNFNTVLGIVSMLLVMVVEGFLSVLLFVRGANESNIYFFLIVSIIIVSLPVFSALITYVDYKYNKIEL